MIATQSNSEAAQQASIGVNPGWFTQAMTLVKKDIRAELRTRTAISSVGLFTISALMLIAVATATLKDAQAYDRLADTFKPAWDGMSKMGMLWVLLCFAAFSGLSHSFVHEEEGGTTLALRMNMSAPAVYAGKLIYNTLLLIAVAVVVTPMYMAITDMPLGSPVQFFLVMLSGIICLSGAATIVAALAAKAHSSGALFGAIGLPLLIVFLMLLLNAANTLFTINPPWIRFVRDTGGLFSYGILLIAISYLIFQYVWED